MTYIWEFPLVRNPKQNLAGDSTYMKVTRSVYVYFLLSGSPSMVQISLPPAAGTYLSHGR